MQKDYSVINRILLRNISSYSPDSIVSIGPLQRVSLFYGHNGTGKTTISNYLQAPNDACYSSCAVEPAKEGRQVLVYNHYFVEKNFHETASQPGVFTLNEGNIEAKATLEAAESTIVALMVSHDSEMEKGVKSKKVQGEAYETLLKSVWESKRNFDGTALAYCFKNLNTKERLLEATRSFSLVATHDTVEGLLREAAELSETIDQELPKITIVSFHAEALEFDPIMQEIITGSGDSYLSAFIQQLGNSDWVKHALNFESKANEQCPLCQQSLPNGFYDEIRKVFDQTYEQRIRLLNQFKTRYKDAVDIFLRQFAAPIYQKQAIQHHVNQLHILFQKNLQSISNKISSPSLSIALDSTAELIGELNNSISVEQQKIDATNTIIKNRKQLEDNIKSRFWAWFRSSCDAAIVTFEKVDEEHGRLRQAAKDEILSLRRHIQTQRDIISRSKAATTNIDQSIESINTWLKVLGLKGFILIKHEGEVPQYRLERPNQDKGVFKTLSEGEKTLISFLYFLEVCNGELDATSGQLKSERIIVIDDPISSLSHNYIYDIASLIRRQVLVPRDRFKQVLILTHNLFFFHEIAKLLREDKENPLAMFRITKSHYSVVMPMEEREVQNDYQAFWQTLKDALQGRTSPNVIPNMMRNILEYYFSFVHQTPSLRKALFDLSDENPEFRALYRYINRESHADAINLTDFGEIEPAAFVERFREVFVKTNFESHYDKMMN